MKLLKLYFVFSIFIAGFVGYILGGYWGSDGEYLWMLIAIGIKIFLNLAIYKFLDELEAHHIQQQTLLVEIQNLQKIFGGKNKRCKKCGKVVEEERQSCPYCASQEFEESYPIKMAFREDSK